MEKNTKSATSATRTATANAKSAAKTTTPKTAAAATTPTPAAPAIGFLPKVAVVDPIKGTPAEAKPTAPALKLTKSEIVPPISAAAEEAKPATTAKTETKPAAEAKQEKPTEAAKETPKTETPKEATPAPTTAAPAAETEQKPAEPTPAPAPAPLSAEEAAAAAIRAAEEADRKRRESLAEMQKRLDEELEKLNHKREIAEKREMFIKCREDIENYIGELEEETEFETSICRLSFERFTKDGLSREEFKKVMTVSNTAIVKKFCEAMSAEICAKVGEIENELLTA